MCAKVSGSFSAKRDGIEKRTNFGEKGLRDYVYFPLILDERIRTFARNVSLGFSVVSALLVVLIFIYAFELNHTYLNGEYPLIPRSQLLLHSFLYVNLVCITLALLVNVASFVVFFMCNQNMNRIWLIRTTYFEWCTLALKWTFCASIVLLLYILLVYERSRGEFNRAIRNILTNGTGGSTQNQLERQLMFERAQSKLSCCGGNSPQDWNRNPMWKYRPRCASLQPYIPPSCCDIDSETGCLDYVGLNLEWTDMAKWSNNHYQKGCTRKFALNYNWYVERALYAWIVLTAIFAGNHLMMQYFRVSCHFALIFGENSMVHGYGWLYGPPMDSVALLELTKDISQDCVFSWYVTVHLRKSYHQERKEWYQLAGVKPLAELDQKRLKEMDNVRINYRGVISTVDGNIGYRVADHVQNLAGEAGVQMIRSNVATMSRIS